jgi:hypothetical protein
VVVVEVVPRPLLHAAKTIAPTAAVVMIRRICKFLPGAGWFTRL